jgi:Mg-chelatase subunit ChlD/surface antigen
MRTNRVFSLVILTTFVVTAGCDDGLSPLRVGGHPPVATVEPIGLVLHRDFARNGEFAISYLPKATSGELVQATTPRIGAEVISESHCYDVAILGSRFEQPLGKQLDVALILDSSGTMRSSDRDRLRVTAAEAFAQAILSTAERNRVGVFDFGAGSSDGFRWSRMLTGLTSVLSQVLEAASRVVASGNTPMYASIHEILAYLDSEKASAAVPLVVVLADGQPNAGNVTGPQVVERALGLSIPIHTVGLGPAAAAASGNNTTAVNIMQELATATGGMYTSVSSADELVTRLDAVATGAALGRVITGLRLDPLPAEGDRIVIRVQFGSRGEVEAIWMLQVPDGPEFQGLGCRVEDDYPYPSEDPDSVDHWNFYYRECTSFAAWRIRTRTPARTFSNQYGGVDGWSDAHKWLEVAASEKARAAGVQLLDDPAVSRKATASGPSQPVGLLRIVACVKRQGTSASGRESGRGKLRGPVRWVRSLVAS